MSRLPNHAIWGEMARRKQQFHFRKDWDKIRLWGLFLWGEVSHKLETGELITDMKKENHTIWVQPSKEAYHKHIEPLLEGFEPFTGKILLTTERGNNETHKR